MAKELRGSEAWARGIREYSVVVLRCPACTRPCNTYWQPSWRETPIFACSQECADKLKNLRSS